MKTSVLAKRSLAPSSLTGVKSAGDNTLEDMENLETEVIDFLIPLKAKPDTLDSMISATMANRKMQGAIEIDASDTVAL